MKYVQQRSMYLFSIYEIYFLYSYKRVHIIEKLTCLIDSKDWLAKVASSQTELQTKLENSKVHTIFLFELKF